MMQEIIVEYWPYIVPLALATADVSLGLLPDKYVRYAGLVRRVGVAIWQKYKERKAAR
jgi:hypothetical protein